MERAPSTTRGMHSKGIVGNTSIDWPELMAFKRGFTDPVPATNEQRYADQGLDTHRGPARFTGRNSLEVDGQVLQARHVLIAARTEPIKLGFPGEGRLVILTSSAKCLPTGGTHAQTPTGRRSVWRSAGP